MTSSAPRLEPLSHDDTHTLTLTRSVSPGESLMGSIASLRSDMADSHRWKSSRWRHPLGIALLMGTVCLWTLSNFLASTIFADDTYSKPFFVTYVNSSFFVVPLIPCLMRIWRTRPHEIADLMDYLRRRSRQYAPLATSEDDSKPPSPLLGPQYPHSSQKLSLHETLEIALPFGFLWFFANWSSVACFAYTTVGSATILTSTSSIWTLILGAFLKVEHFTVRKLVGVLASLAGVILISTLDFSAGDDKDRGSFPHKTAKEIAAGDALAFASSVIYGLYIVVLKRRIGDESRVNMPLFFGLVGLLNLLLMWPAFFFLHILGIETFALPPSMRVITIIAVNSTSSLVSDYCWAFAMLLTSPLVVTVGLSLTIPLSLVGQMVLSGTYSGWAYWLGAVVVVGSFVFVNHEEKKDEEVEHSQILQADA